MSTGTVSGAIALTITDDETGVPRPAEQADFSQLPAGAATDAKLDELKASVTALQASVDALTTPQDTQPVKSGPFAPTAIPGASGAVAAGAVALMGFTVRETSGTAAAVLRLRDGVVGGPVLATIALNPSESIPFQPLNAAVLNAAGVYVQLVSGAVEGSVLTA